jgi:hypothetical protein
MLDSHVNDIRSRDQRSIVALGEPPQDCNRGPCFHETPVDNDVQSLGKPETQYGRRTQEDASVTCTRNRSMHAPIRCGTEFSTPYLFLATIQTRSSSIKGFKFDS